MAESTINLQESLTNEITRVREIHSNYIEIGLPGVLASALIGISLQNAETAIANGDVVQMIAAYKDLKKFTE